MTLTGQGDPKLHNLRPPKTQLLPLHNSIPPELEPRFDPIYVEYYNKYNAGRLHTHEIPIEEYRKDPTHYTISYGRAEGPDIFRITEQKCPVNGGEITVRIFEPAPKVDGSGHYKKRAAYLNFHGGGWVFGGLQADHDFCKRIVDGLDGDLVAFDVDYRLAPENKYPTPVDDCWAAINWVISPATSICLESSNQVTVYRFVNQKQKSSILILIVSRLVVPLQVAISQPLSPISAATRTFPYDYRF